MHKKYILILILYVLCLNLSAQDFKGVWISEYGEEIQRRTETSFFENDTLVVKELDYVQIDTFYHNAYLLIDFISEDELLFGGAGGKQTYGTYEVSNDTLIIKLDTLNLKAIFDDEHLMILDTDSSWSNSTVFLARFDTDELNLNNKVNSDLFINTKWKSDADTSSIHYGLEFYFYDSTNAIITWRNGIHTSCFPQWDTLAIFLNNRI